MVGKNALWIAKQHGHSIATMLRAYAAWAEGAAEADSDIIKRSMNLTPTRRPRIRSDVGCRYGRRSVLKPGISLAIDDLAVDLSLAQVINDFSEPKLIATGAAGEARKSLPDSEFQGRPDDGWGGRIIRPGRASPLRGRPPGVQPTRWLNQRDHDRATDRSTRLTEPSGRYPSRRDSTLEPSRCDE
jgi:hypothetical protein